jgi:leucyl-tRNA synthetase
MSKQANDYDFSSIEPKWQDHWEADKTFYTRESKEAPKYYVLDMFPYPSGAGLHIGHPEGYTASDALKRFKKAQGHNVLHPMGWDAFGLPTEQYAIKTGTHPKATTAENIRNFKRQLRSLGFSYDWSREINTTDPDYFRWTQWIFKQLFKRGLAYVEDKPVWFCPELGTVLANEEVLTTPAGPRSERGHFPVERRPIRQWVLRITDYAERLIAGLKDLDWPDSTKRLQENWIGRSEGAEIDFQIANSPEQLTVFTTRADTLYGASYMVIAPEHPLLAALTSPQQAQAVQDYVAAARSKSDLERAELAKEKTGVFSGAYAINPINQKQVPIWVADYVLMSYGTGAIMAVPAHDQRDFEFAQCFDLRVLPVIQAPEEENESPQQDVRAAYTGPGKLCNSGPFDGLTIEAAQTAIIQQLAAKGQAKACVQYKLRDWLFSRQRYWGEPFPILWLSEADYAQVDAAFKAKDQPVSCQIDGVKRFAIVLPDSALPLELPTVESYTPSPDGQSPLSKAPEWLQVYFDPKTGATASQPQAGWIPAQRETNTMPQWAGSCWYYLRYIDANNPAQLIGRDAMQYWGTPDLYIGGAEHAVLHLLYARFWHQVLFDLGVVDQPEPFKKLFHQGIILGEDGEKMSKSRGNVVSPESIIASHGADALRLYLMFLGPLEAMKPWNTKGIEGIARFLRKTWRLVIDASGQCANKIQKDSCLDPESERILQASIKKVTEDYEALSFNTAISQLMICLNSLAKVDTLPLESVRTFLQLLAPLAPHICEELWQRLGHSGLISEAQWPRYQAEKLQQATVKVIFQVNGKYRGDAQLDPQAEQSTALELAQQQEKVTAQLAGKTIKRVIYVPGKILNIVAV